MAGTTAALFRKGLHFKKCQPSVKMADFFIDFHKLLSPKTAVIDRTEIIDSDE